MLHIRVWLRWLSLFGLVLLAWALSACSGDPSGCGQVTSDGPKVQVLNAWARAASMKLAEAAPTSAPGTQMGGTPAMQMSVTPGITANDASTSAIYFTLRNCGKQPDVLTGASTSMAKFAGIHKTQTTNNITVMTQVQKLIIGPASKLEFQPGGLHVMLMDLQQDLTVGGKVQFSLFFEKSGNLDFEAEVKAP